MNQSSTGSAPPERTPEDRLDSWKQIALYLKRDVTTVQRWEKREGMPVHRHLHDSIGSVYASKVELDSWTRSRKPVAGQENGGNTIGLNVPVPKPDITCELSRPVIATPRIPWRYVGPLVAAAILLAISINLWLRRTEPFWRNPIANARFQNVTDFSGLEEVPRCRAMAVWWRFCQTGRDKLMYGLRR